MFYKSLIRSIPNYPKQGVMFRDITTLLQNPTGFRSIIDGIVQRYVGEQIDAIVGIEARGFIVGGAVAHQLSVGFVPVRKVGKLPWDTIGQDYELEYGTDRLEMHLDAVEPGKDVLVVDDLIATGGTVEAAINLIQKSGATVVGCAFVIGLPDLGGQKRLQDMGIEVLTLCEFEGE